jgi:hypothetical protein
MTHIAGAGGFTLGGFSISDNRLSGFVGGVLGGALGLFGALIVVWAEGHRRRRDQKAALRLLTFEISTNLHTFETVADQGAGATKLLMMAVWEKEQVPVASYLTFKNLGTVAMPYLRLAAVLRYRDGFDHVSFGNWLAGLDGQRNIQSAIAEFTQAQEVLGPKTMTLRRRFDRWWQRRWSKRASG